MLRTGVAKNQSREGQGEQSMIWAECKAALNYLDSEIPWLPDLRAQMSKQ